LAASELEIRRKTNVERRNKLPLAHFLASRASPGASTAQPADHEMAPLGMVRELDTITR
jgi:hypothetical protein